MPCFPVNLQKTEFPPCPRHQSGHPARARCVPRGLPWLITVALFFAAPAARPAEFPGAAEFASDLLQKHAPLVPALQRPLLDEINRRLREADRQARSAPSPAEAEAARQRRLAAAGDLNTLLEGLPGVLRTALDGPRLSPTLPAPLRLPSDEGGFLLRLDAGPGPGPAPTGAEARFVTFDLDQSRPELTGLIRLDASPGGTFWVLLGFHHLPTRRSTFPLEIPGPGGSLARTLLSVETPLTGEARIELLDDDTGGPSPAMVRLTSRTTGRDRRPGNVVDFGGQFDGNGSPSAQRRANLPGRLGGPWWCVAGPFSVSLPPGSYELAVRRGIEHRPVFTNFTVASGGLTSLVIRPRRWTDLRRLGWYSGDDHVHGRILSNDDADRLMAWVRAEDIHVANVVKMGDVFRTFFEQRGWGPEFRVLHTDHILSPGQECPRTHDQLGHTLSMNTRSMIRDTDRYYLYDRVADEAHAQGGLFGYAHVNSDLFHVHRDMSLNVPRGKIDFGEVLQFNKLGTELWYEFLDLGFKFTASAGSDVPWGGTVGEVRMYAYTGRRRFSADNWFEAVRQGRTFVTSGPLLEFHVNDALPGDELRVDRPDRRLRIQARTWCDPERSLPRRLTVVRHGQVIGEATPAHSGDAELNLELELEAGDGFWIAARADADDGTAAHTTPIYVVRPPRRFWNPARVQELLAKRLANLREIEDLVADARARDQAGALVGDQPVGQLARQADALLERVAIARGLYEDLQRQVPPSR